MREPALVLEPVDGLRLRTRLHVDTHQEVDATTCALLRRDVGDVERVGREGVVVRQAEDVPNGLWLEEITSTTQGVRQLIAKARPFTGEEVLETPTNLLEEAHRLRSRRWSCDACS